jgi:hypothetical protein
MAVLFLLGKDAAQDRIDAEGWKDTRGKPGGLYLFRGCAAGKLIAGSGVAPKR